MIKKNKIKKRILLPVGIALYFIIVVFYAAISGLMNLHNEFDSQKNLKSVTDILSAHKAEDIKILTSTIYIFQNDNELKEYWLSKNREKLYLRAKELKKIVSASSNFTYFYFHDTNSVNFLQVHNPDKFGEKFANNCLQQASEAKIVASGFDIMQDGTLILEVVVPWYIDGKLQGYIHLGESIEHQLNTIHQSFDVQLLVFTANKHKDKTKYQKENINGSWDNIQNLQLSYKTVDWKIEDIHEILKNYQEKDIHNFDYLEKYYLINSLNLHDANLEYVAKILILLDISENYKSTNSIMRIVLGISFLAGTFLIILFYVILGKIEKGLDLSEYRAVNEGRLRELEQIKHISDLEEDKRLLKISEEKIRESTQKNKSILEAIPDLIFIFDKDGVFLDYHSHDVNQLSISPESFIGKNISDVLPREISKITKENILQTLESGSGRVFRYTIPFGGKKLSEEARMVKFGEDKVLTIIRDITEVLNAEMKLIEAKEKAEAADKLKSIFLAQMSHEIRTPINSIVSLSYIVEEELSQYADEDIATCFSLIKSSGDRIIRTVDLILNLSEVMAGTYQKNFNVFNLVEKVLKNLFQEYLPIAKSKNLEFKFEDNSVNKLIEADLYTLEQIFIQLLDNAFKYTENGTIKLRVFSELEDEIIVEVVDEGIGISEEYLAKLFIPFSQEQMGYTRLYEGNGIGLALVYEYCKLNKATISAKSTKGEGSTFTIKFTNCYRKDLEVQQSNT